MTQGLIRIAAALVVRPDGRTLLVRKRGTAAFMQPGGKIEAGEDAAAALCRELREELGLSVDAGDVQAMGRFSAPAANEPGWMVEADVFYLGWAGPVALAAEIEEMIWIDPAHPGDLVLAPLTRDRILPLAGARNDRC